MRLDSKKLREAIAHGSVRFNVVFENEIMLSSQSYLSFDLWPVSLATFQEIVLGHAEKGDSFEFCRELAVSSSVSTQPTHAWVKSILKHFLKKQVPKIF